MSLKNKFNAVGVTDTGRIRDHNEDAIGSNLDAGLHVLADGMGGYNAGEVASSIAVKTVVELATEEIRLQKIVCLKEIDQPSPPLRTYLPQSLQRELLFRILSW